MSTQYSELKEADIQDKIIKALRNIPNTFTLKLAAGPFMLPGVPDILHISGGRAYFFEVKRPAGEGHKAGTLTRLQRMVIEAIRKAGAVAEVVYGVEDVEGILNPTHCPHGDDWDRCPVCCH